MNLKSSLGPGESNGSPAHTALCCPLLPLQQLTVAPFQVGNEMFLYWLLCWLQNVPFYLFFPLLTFFQETC